MARRFVELVSHVRRLIHKGIANRRCSAGAAMRPRYSLRTLVFLVTSVAVALGWYARERPYVEAIKEFSRALDAFDERSTFDQVCAAADHAYRVDLQRIARSDAAATVTHVERLAAIQNKLRQFLANRDYSKAYAEYVGRQFEELEVRRAKLKRSIENG